MRPAVSPAAVGLDLSSGAPASMITWPRMLARLPPEVWDAPRHQGQGDLTWKSIGTATRTYLATADAAQRRRPQAEDELRRAREAAHSVGPPAAWTPAWDIARDAEQDHLHRGPSAHPRGVMRT